LDLTGCISRSWRSSSGCRPCSSISYGVDPAAIFRQLGFYVAKILNGAKPTDLPVEQAVKFELVINLKTAKAIGVELSTAIQLRADEVIE
jgi:putative ABC transport system substrate-binding protein